MISKSQSIKKSNKSKFRPYAASPGIECTFIAQPMILDVSSEYLYSLYMLLIAASAAVGTVTAVIK